MIKNRDMERYSDSYLEAPFTKENVEYRRKCILQQIMKYPHKNILEIGCGMYPICFFIEPEEYEKYTIVEPCTLFIENAKKEIEKRQLQKVELKKGYFEKVKVTGHYDFVICSSLLHEVTFPLDLLNAMWDVSENDTILHVNVPNAFSLHRLIAKEAGLIADIYELSERNRELQQNAVYDIDSLKKQIEEAGFSILEEGSYFIKPFTHRQMAEMLECGIINQEILEGLWKLTKYLPDYGSEIYVNFKKKTRR